MNRNDKDSTVTKRFPRSYSVLGGHQPATVGVQCPHCGKLSQVPLPVLKPGDVPFTCPHCAERYVFTVSVTHLVKETTE